MYAEMVAALYDPHSNPVWEPSPTPPPPPPALSNVGKYADGTMKLFTISQIYNKIAFSLYSSLLSIRYFELGNLEREEREKRGIDRKQARVQKGTGGPEPPPPPLRFVRGEVLCRGLMSTCRRGGPKVVFNLLLSFFSWLASLASIIQTYYIYTYFQVQYSVWNGHPFSIFPLSKLWKESNFPSLASWNGILVQNCTILHHLRHKFSGRGPPPRHITL